MACSKSPSFQDFPPHVRRKIYRQSLLSYDEYLPRSAAPAFLLALAPIPTLFAEALYIYKDYTVLRDQGFFPSKPQSMHLPETPFPFRELPPEIRLKIYPMNCALALTPDLRPPPLLLALFPEKELYAEAREIYLSTNEAVSRGTLKAFKKKPLSEMLKIRHIRLHYTALQGQDYRNLINGNKMCLMNKLHSIMAVLEPDVDPDHMNIERTLLPLCSGGAGSVRRIYVVVSPRHRKHKWKGWLLSTIGEGRTRTENLGLVETATGTGTMWRIEAVGEEGLTICNHVKGSCCF